MKRSAFLLGLLAGAATLNAPAQASDMDLPPEYRSSTFDIYIGTFAGGNWLTSEYEDIFAEETHGLDGVAFGWGVRAGVDYNVDNWVFGVVGDASFGQIIAEDNKLNVSLDMPVLGTARVRAGRHWGDTLLYATGGYAQAQFKFSDKENDTDGTDWAKGWTLGVGADYQMTDALSIGLEYLYINLGDVDYASESYEQEFQNLQTIRIGLDYRFHI